MRTWLVAAVTLMSIAGFSQVPLPGTFTTAPEQTTQYGTPIVSPPIVSLGNGLTPTLVTNRPTIVAGAPASVMVGPPIVTPGGFVVPSTSYVGAKSVTENPPETQPEVEPKVVARKRFDFVVPSSGVATAAQADTRSLAEVAAGMRKSGLRPMTGKAFTNDDVTRMNQKYGNQSQPVTPTKPGPGAAMSAQGGVSGTAVQTGTQPQQDSQQSPPATANPNPR